MRMHRLHNLHPKGLAFVFGGLLDAARADPGKVAWKALEMVKAQVGMKFLPEPLAPEYWNPEWVGHLPPEDWPRWIIYLRRPGGKEYPQELEALCKALGLELLDARYVRGRISRGGFKGPRAYLVGFARKKKAALAPEGPVCPGQTGRPGQSAQKAMG